MSLKVEWPEEKARNETMSKDAKYEFKVHESATQRLCSATALVKLLLLEEPTILLEHRKEFLKLALWKITEAESVAKDRTRYCSATAYKSPESKLTHDHVFQRAKMAEELLAGGAQNAERILKKAKGCTITKEEHKLLEEPKDSYGWQRYRRAGITVVDAKNGKILDLAGFS